MRPALFILFTKNRLVFQSQRLSSLTPIKILPRNSKLKQSDEKIQPQGKENIFKIKIFEKLILLNYSLQFFDFLKRRSGWNLYIYLIIITS